jgi:hypothetical protein
MVAPELIIQMGERRGVNLTGDLYAAMEYADLTEGDSFEDAFFKLRPAIEAFEKGEKLKGKFDPTPYVDLLWAFSANWRDDKGWNSQHVRDQDGEKKSVRKTGPYIAMMKSFSHHALRELRPKIFGLLLRTIYPPEVAEADGGDAPRSEDSSPESVSIGA